MVAEIDVAYRTISSKKMRSVAGLSMGGYGAVMLALRNPNVFGAAASLSGALSSFNHIEKEVFDSLNFPQIFGPHRGSYANSYDLHVLAELRKKDAKTDFPDIYINCGKDDRLYNFNVEFHDYLTKINYDHEYAEFHGGHTWEYWSEHLKDVLLFFEKRYNK